MTKTAYVYALIDANEDIRYVGSTGMDIQERAAIHHRHRNSDTGRGNPELNAWLRGMHKPPRAVLLAEVAWDDRIKVETSCTRRARDMYKHLLLNKMDGATPTADLLERNRREKRGHYIPHTEEARLRISAGMKRAWDRRRSYKAEQARLEAEMGRLFRIPRTTAELREQQRICAEQSGESA